MTDDAAIMTLDSVRFGFAPRPDFLGPVSVSVRRGACLAIIGPNGAGKSTLLRLMGALLRPHAGSIMLEGRPLAHITPRDRARKIAYVPQQAPQGIDESVREVVLLGRFPHRTWGLFESTGDHRIAERAMRQTGTRPFADRPLVTLSGGEAQRVHVAAALAQEPSVMLLDEPTASLDLRHQLAVFEILCERARADQLAIVVATHDVNLAARYCDRVLVLHDGRVVAQGPPDEAITPEALAPVYGVELVTLTAEGDQPLRWVVPLATAGSGGSA